MERIKLRLGFSHAFISPSHGLSGGLCLLWHDDIDLFIRSDSSNHIDAKCGGIENSIHWRLTGFYCLPSASNGHLSWSLLNSLGLHSKLPWLCFRDFNEVVSLRGKCGGNLRAERQIANFRQALSAYNLVDLGYVGSDFTRQITWRWTSNAGCTMQLLTLFGRLYCLSPGLFIGALNLITCPLLLRFVMPLLLPPLTKGDFISRSYGAIVMVVKTLLEKAGLAHFREGSSFSSLCKN
ncbi:PREDICTED: reverse mRNAase [Prunus dulcis]|uniref:PREDICTED: reverse mRNAase n=1 Tax=Prunus dulcis TaxID=3755 RepID=A0A5E4FS75_PRUDU|nr:PREDICTED: reverse mRNAase [Prunus dulcis]